MGYRIRRVDYYYATVQDRPGEAYKVLSGLADSGVNLLALAGLPIGVNRTQLTLFPEDSNTLQEVARKVGLALDGPNPAVLVQGDDELGALAAIHERLYAAHVNVFASTGITDGKGAYGYVLYIRPGEYDRAAQALEI